jgi:transposase
MEIAAELNISRQKAARCRRRFLQSGLTGLERDAPRPGRPRRIDAQAIVRTTTQQTPPQATHWSTRSLAQVAGVVEKLEDIVGLYLNPPQHALVFSADEKSQIQALERSQPGLPLKKGRAQSMTHDYKRHGTTTLFAALNTLDGTVVSQCRSRHTHQDWIAFLCQIDRETAPDKQIHVIADNYAAHKHPKVQQWLRHHPRFHLHYTPTSASWLNMVERLFRDLSQQRLRRGVFHRVRELIAAIQQYIADHNRHPKPFVWTAKASDILQKVTRARRTLHMLQSQ